MNTTLKAITPASLPRPAYLEEIATGIEFNTHIQRITGDSGKPIPGVGGTWNIRSRHHYSKDQPFSHDGKMLKLQQKSGNPGNLVVDAQSYAPLWSDRGTSKASKFLKAAHETRWRPGHPTQMVSVERRGAGIDVVIWDVLSGLELNRMRVASPDPKFGWIGEGQISDDGRWTVFTTSVKKPFAAGAEKDYIVVVDLERGRVGPRCDVSYCVTAFKPKKASQGMIGNCGISCLGNYAEVKISGDYQYGFVLKIDKDSLVASRHPTDLDALRMGSVDAQGLRGAGLGTLPFLSHPDCNLSSDGREVCVGGGRGFELSRDPQAGKKYGNVLMVDLETGKTTHVSPGESHLGGVRASSMQHGSGRAHKRRGWHLISTEITGEWGRGEIMWVKLDGSRKVERLCHHRSDEAGNYDAEAHPCASPDGSRVVFASNWRGAGGVPRGPAAGDIKAYVVTS